MPTVLAFQSNPDDEVRLALDKEIREINNAIAPIARRDFRLIQLGAVKIADLPQYILEHKPDIFHFCGHGTANGELVFQGDYNESQSINNEAIDLLFGSLGKSIKCVVLSSCFSEKQAKRIAEFIPFVIGNSEPIRDEVAILFSSNLYRALSYGKSVYDAFDIAKGVIGAGDKKILKIPVLFNQTPVSRDQAILFRQPVVKACFKLDKRNNPRKKKGNELIMKVWVENLPSNTLSVVYNYNHDTIDDDMEEMQNDGSGIDSECELYGNIQLRITLWFKNEGVGIITSLYEALQNYYRDKELSEPVRNALKQIEEN